MEDAPAVKMIYSTIKVKGFHCWPNAPEHLKFLRDRHRHVFEIKGTVMVRENDREVEFFELARKMEKYINKQYLMDKDGFGCEFGYMSCEMIAEDVAKACDLYSCEVSEDGENGAIWISLLPPMTLADAMP